MNHYRSEASRDQLDKALKDALHRLLAVARRVQSLAGYRAAAGTVKGEVPDTYGVVKDHILGAYKRLCLEPHGQPRRIRRVDGSG